MVVPFDLPLKPSKNERPLILWEKYTLSLGRMQACWPVG